MALAALGDRKGGGSAAKSSGCFSIVTVATGPLAWVPMPAGSFPAPLFSLASPAGIHPNRATIPTRTATAATPLKPPLSHLMESFLSSFGFRRHQELPKEISVYQ